MMLSPADEFFTHQTALPHALVATSDPSWRERYWISIQDTEGSDTVLTCGFGRYPNQDVVEGFAVVSTDGRQHNLRLARQMLPAPNDIAVGPFRVEVVEPLRTLRLILDDNPSGLAFDLEWRATVHPLLEHRHYQVARARVIHDLVRYAQVGRAAGELTVDGRTLAVSPETWWCERDHSWGLRPLPRVEGAPPGQRPEWKLLMFCPLQFETFGLHLYAYEAEPGKPLHLSGGILTGLGEEPVEDDIVDLQHDLEWVEGALAPTLQRGTLEYTLASGRRLDVELTARPGRALLRGGGYEGWGGWFQGQWKGEDSLEHEVWDLTDQSTFRRYAKASSDHLVEARCEGESGFGIIEYMLLPGYARYTDAAT